MDITPACQTNATGFLSTFALDGLTVCEVWSSTGQPFNLTKCCTPNMEGNTQITIVGNCNYYCPYNTSNPTFAATDFSECLGPGYGEVGCMGPADQIANGVGIARVSVMGIVTGMLVAVGLLMV